MNNCSEIRELMSLYIDEELDEIERVEFEKHIELCGECRKELAEIKNIISMCSSIGEEELPDSFRDELHLKLLAVKEENDSKNKILKLRKKYIKIISTAAACLLVAILAKGFFDGSYFPKFKQDSMVKSEADQIADDSVNSFDTKSESSALEVKDEKEADTSEKNGAKADETYEFTAKGQSDIDNMAQEAQDAGASRSTKTDERIQCLQSVPDENPCSNTALITVKTSGSLDTSVEEIKKAALDKGAEFTDQSDGNKLINGVQASTEEKNAETILNFKILKNEYQGFYDSLTKYAGSENTSVELDREDMSSVIEFYDKKLDEIETEISTIEKSKVASNPEELQVLKDERDNIIAEIERIKLDSDYIFMTIYVEPKASEQLQP